MIFLSVLMECLVRVSVCHEGSNFLNLREFQGWWWWRMGEAKEGVTVKARANEVEFLSVERR